MVVVVVLSLVSMVDGAPKKKKTSSKAKASSKAITAYMPNNNPLTHLVSTR